MSDYEIIDPRFRATYIGHARLEKLYTGCRWAEGPAYQAAMRCLIWSDIPNNRLMRYSEEDGHVSVFRAPSNNANGNFFDREGRLVSCEHLSRSVTRTEHDGSITTLAAAWQGKRLNSPNDLVVRSDGSIWFTDPSYGILADYEGRKSDSEIGACNVYRIDPRQGRVEAVATDFVKPNGIAFSPDEKILYVADSGGSRGDGPRHIRAFHAWADGRLTEGRVFADCTAGVFDGFRCDSEGRIWTSAADGVHCYDPDGTLLGKIKVPEIVANVCFGGPRLNRLYICGQTSLYSIFLAVNGVKTY